MRLRVIHIIFILCFSTIVLGAGGVLPGAGTDLNPYRIEDYTDLKKIGTNPYTVLKVYELANDIDASLSSTENGGLGFKSLASSSAPFKGKLYGRGYSIKNLYINRGAYSSVGLFTYIQSPGLIDSLGMEDGYIKGKKYVGSIVGTCKGNTIRNCFNTNNVISVEETVGGIAGYVLNGHIDSCWNSGTIESEGINAGGIAGYLYDDSLTNCYNTGDISSVETAGGIIGLTGHFSSKIKNSYNLGSINTTSKQSGGIIGKATDGTIEDCQNYGTISSSLYAGGVVGYNSAAIHHCYNTSDITGNTYVGGIVGYSNGDDITECYNTGSCSGTSFIGGLAGQLSSEIHNSYSTGDITGITSGTGGALGQSFYGTLDSCYTSGIISGNFNTGGSVGFSFDSSFPNTFFDYQTAGTTTAIGSAPGHSGSTPIGYTTSQLKNSSTLSPFDFNAIWGIRNDSTFAALKNINNAPFAFIDTIRAGVTIATSGLLLDTCLANDYDYETLQDSLIFSVISTTNATTDPTKIYFATPPINGDIMSFTYRVGEKNATLPSTLLGNTSETVIIMDNRAPIIQTLSFSINEDAISKLGLQASDLNNDPATFSILTNGVNGIGSILDDTLTYTPNLNYYGSDSLFIISSDGLANDTSWVTITISPVNDAPNARDTTINQVAGLPITIELPISDVDDNVFTGHIYISPSNGSAFMTYDSLQYVSDEFFSGSDTVRWYATDFSGLSSDTALFIISTIPPNLSISTSSLEIDEVGGQTSVSINSNTEWTVSSSETWCQVGQSSGEFNDVLTIDVDTNYNAAGRTAYITFSASGISDVILTIDQLFIATTSVTLSNDTLSACAGSSLVLPYTLISGEPTQYRVLYNTAALDAGFTNTSYENFTSNLYVSVPGTIAYGTYSASVQFRNKLGVESVQYPFSFIVNISSSIISNKKTALIIDTTSYNFIDYQWYKDGSLLENETNHYLTDIDGFKGDYSVRLMLADSSFVFTCPKTYNQQNNIATKLYPSPIRNDESFTIEFSSIVAQEATYLDLYIFHVSGKLVYKTTLPVKEKNVINFTKTVGHYLIHVELDSGRFYSYKLIVKD